DRRIDRRRMRQPRAPANAIRSLEDNRLQTCLREERRGDEAVVTTANDHYVKRHRRFWRLSQIVLEAVADRSGGCRRSFWRLSQIVLETVAVRSGGCRRSFWRLS